MLNDKKGIGKIMMDFIKYVANYEMHKIVAMVVVFVFAWWIDVRTYRKE